MRNPITTRQKQLLEIIYEFIRNSGYPPTLHSRDISSNEFFSGRFAGSTVPAKKDAASSAEATFNGFFIVKFCDFIFYKVEFTDSDFINFCNHARRAFVSGLRLDS